MLGTADGEWQKATGVCMPIGTTKFPTTESPTTETPTTLLPTTEIPTDLPTTESPTIPPTTLIPTQSPHITYRCDEEGYSTYLSHYSLKCNHDCQYYIQ